MERWTLVVKWMRLQPGDDPRNLLKRKEAILENSLQHGGKETLQSDSEALF